MIFVPIDYWTHNGAKYRFSLVDQDLHLFRKCSTRGMLITQLHQWPGFVRLNVNIAYKFHSQVRLIILLSSWVGDLYVNLWVCL